MSRMRSPTGARSSVVEQLAFNQLVVGSIPTGLTKKLSVLILGCQCYSEREVRWRNEAVFARVVLQGV